MIRNETNNAISYESLQLELPDRGKRHEYLKKLIATMKGSIILERIACNNCLTIVNPLCEAVPVNVRKMAVGAKTYVVLEPQCPVCGTFIACETFFHIEN
jgi:hypothetical protein